MIRYSFKSNGKFQIMKNSDYVPPSEYEKSLVDRSFFVPSALASRNVAISGQGLYDDNPEAVSSRAVRVRSKTGFSEIKQSIASEMVEEFRIGILKDEAESQSQVQAQAQAQAQVQVQTEVQQPGTP